MVDTSKVFSIHGRGLRFDSAADIEPHLRDLRAVREEVEEIHLGGNTFGIDASLALATVLKELTALKIADFADIFTGRLITEIPTSLSAICDALIESRTLIELNLSDNAFGGRSAEPMVPFLTRNYSLQVLKLNNNGLGVSGGTIIANALSESARASLAEGRPSNLRVVVCGRNRLENGSSAAWAEAFAAHKGLEEVRLPQNGIRAEGIQTLAEGLAQNKGLRHLDLQDNTATEQGARAIARALPSWPELHALNLSDLLIGRHGGIALALALAKGATPRLVTLQLQYNELTKHSLDILARAITEHLSGLATLELNGNKVDPEDECIQKIKEALERHGHEDALDELDDMEEEEEEEEEEEGEEKEEVGEEEVEGEPKKAEPILKPTLDEATDALADLMGKASLGSK